MLLLLFEVNGEVYALDCGSVLEVVPFIRLKQIPMAPEYVRGLFLYRGRVVPVIDLSLLAGRGSSQRLFSTRIVLVKHEDGRGELRVLGIIAERATETVRAGSGDLEPSGVRVKGSPYLGGIIMGERGMIQCIRLETLMDSVQDVLFSDRRE